ncbi:hypothetical protein AB1Y20_016025 [Prymnesium parvum]|uniref:Phosphoglycolate phosphatase n=1 Tax=Prymnesium parvum TaxID=97485 RepID=A0AB34JZK5_PRYPA
MWRPLHRCAELPLHCFSAAFHRPPPPRSSPPPAPPARGAPPAHAPLSSLDVIVFDKDGTLLDFAATWLSALREVAEHVAASVHQPSLATQLLRTGGYLPATAGRAAAVSAGSIMLEGTNDELALAWIALHPEVAARWASQPGALAASMSAVLKRASVRDATPLTRGARGALLRMREAGLRLAVVTNDDEELALAQLDRLGWLPLFDAVVGQDSGHGAKPGGGGVSAAIAAVGSRPARALMVGDSATDIAAGRAAGCLGTVAIVPRGAELPSELAAANYRVADLEELVSLLAEQGFSPLRQ